MTKWMLAIIVSVLCTSAHATWAKVFDQQLCSAPCSAVWSHPQISMDGASVFIAQSQGPTTSVWKYSFSSDGSSPVRRVLVYQGAVQTWALDAAPYLLVVRPDGTLLSYDMTLKKQRWSTNVTVPVLSIEALLPGVLLGYTPASAPSEVFLAWSSSGASAFMKDGFGVKRAAPLSLTQAGPSPSYPPLPKSTLKVSESTQQMSVWLNLGTTPTGATHLEGYSDDGRDAGPPACDDCVACGCTK